MSSPAAFRIAGWNLAYYRRVWRLNLMSTFAQPMLYLLGLGVGVGSLVDRNTSSGDALGGIPYAAYVAPGLLVTSAMTVAATESMWPIMGNLRWSRGYHGIAATPLDATDIVLGHATWIAIRSGFTAVLVAIALACFSTTRDWGLVPAVLAAGVIGLSFAMPIMAYSLVAQQDGSFAAIQRFVLIPLFLFGGAFYPLTQLPTAVQWLAKVFPLWHGVVVSRSLTTGSFDAPAAAGHIAYAAVWAAVGAALAVHNLRRKLYP